MHITGKEGGKPVLLMGGMYTDASVWFMTGASNAQDTLDFYKPIMDSYDPADLSGCKLKDYETISEIVEKAQSAVTAGTSTFSLGKTLPERLFDGGYDVWIANTRGQQGSQGNQGANYWDFSFPEYALDIQAYIEHITSTTNAMKVDYIGQCLGSMFMYYGLAQTEN